MAYLRVTFIQLRYIQDVVSADTVQLVERWNDYVEIAGSSPLYATSFLPTMFASWHTSLHAETNQIENTGLRHDSCR